MCDREDAKTELRELLVRFTGDDGKPELQVSFGGKCPLCGFLFPPADLRGFGDHVRSVHPDFALPLPPQE
jgi:hypothetical protein